MSKPFKPVTLATLRRYANKARNQPGVTCSASRHLHLMADGLLSKHGYSMLQEEPEHCAESILAVITALWNARAELRKLKEQAQHTPETGQRRTKRCTEVSESVARE